MKHSPWIPAKLTGPPPGPLAVLVAVAPGPIFLIQREGGAVEVLEFEDGAGAAYIAGALALHAGVEFEP